MKHLSKLVAIATFVAMLATSSVAHATPNDGFRSGRGFGANWAAGIALGTVGAVALIAVLLQSSGGNSSHAHAR